MYGDYCIRITIFLPLFFDTTLSILCIINFLSVSCGIRFQLATSILYMSMNYLALIVLNLQELNVLHLFSMFFYYLI